MTSWDLVVVGAGPAGSAAALGALSAEPGLRVLLLDRADFPRDKVCGDGIAPHVFEALAGAGVTGVADGWRPMRRLELALGGASVARPLSRPVWVIPREVFDARLVERAVDAGAELRRAKVDAVTVSADGVSLAGEHAAVVVGADGAHSAVRRSVVGGRPQRRALALRGYVPTRPEWANAQVIRYGERRQPSYAWAFDRGDGLTNVGYGELLGNERGGPPTRAVMTEELERLLPGASEDGVPGSWKAHHLPLSGWRWHQPDGPVLLAGDASGLINPMTGEGIYYAVATGLAAGRAAVTALRERDAPGAGAAYRRDVRRLLGTHLKHTATAARLSGVPRVVVAGIQAARRDPLAFDDLVELGLGRGRITPRLAGGLLTGLANRSRR
ncbi:NAD(P)/FAD-dependent oxidoreductase [Nocardioides sp. CFH 31398]|uniref:NAD(P)/FAD-dependent oxidoreductase n=1 Tax=Nocardioides sp. CFH 31398 TaxID=2919579 RepID=UPI001F051383|nr:geranylgeranyl reductase family protein [Nocardioides sp. CFH 31398]MCH1868029.1 geranylgeranyl reductase family protein [Nocardioides sp. CFH 31398]